MTMSDFMFWFDDLSLLLMSKRQLYTGFLFSPTLPLSSQIAIATANVPSDAALPSDQDTGNGDSAAGAAPPAQASEDNNGAGGDSLMSESERHLAKGMNRRTWTGPPMLGSIHPGETGLSEHESLIVSLLMGLSRRPLPGCYLCTVLSIINIFYPIMPSDVDDEEAQGEEEGPSATRRPGAHHGVRGERH